MSVSSYTSPKTVKGRQSAIEGRGLFAVEPIAAGEVVAIKGGHIITRRSSATRTSASQRTSTSPPSTLSRVPMDPP